MEDILEIPVYVDKPRLFILHSTAVFLLGLYGLCLSSTVFLLPYQSSPELAEGTRLYMRFTWYIMACFLLLGAAISVAICRKYKIGLLFCLGILIFAGIIEVFSERFLADYIQYILPGTYIAKQAGLIPATILNHIFLLVIPVFLFTRNRPESNPFQR